MCISIVHTMHLQLHPWIGYGNGIEGCDEQGINLIFFILKMTIMISLFVIVYSWLFDFMCHHRAMSDLQNRMDQWTLFSFDPLNEWEVSNENAKMEMKITF